MSDQRSSASVAWSQQGKVTRRERFLGEMGGGTPNIQKNSIAERVLGLPKD